MDTASAPGGHNDTLVCEILQITRRRGLGRSGNGHVFLCAHAAFKAGRAFVQHAAKDLDLTVIELISPPVEQSAFSSGELDLFFSLNLCFQCHIEQPAYPGCDLIRLLPLLQRLVILLLLASIALDRLNKAGRPSPCESAFSDKARPMRPLPSSKGWIDSK